MEYTPSEPVLPADIDRLLQDKGKSYDLGVAARFISTSKGDEEAV